MENQHLRRLIARTRTERQMSLSATSFSASFGRTHNDGGGLLPPGRATRIPLTTSALGIFRVVKTATLISVKQLIHRNLQVALQNAETLTFCFHVNLFLRFSWAKVRNHKKNALIRNSGDAYHIVAALSQEQKSTTQPSMVLVTVDMFTPIFTSLFPSSKRYGIM